MRQGEMTRLGLPHAAPLCVAAITIDGHLDLDEIEGANDLFELWGQSRVVLLLQSDEFRM